MSELNYNFELIKRLYPLHESKIERILREENPDLDEFLDFSQRELNRARLQAADTGMLSAFLKPSAVVWVKQLETIQSVVVKLMNEVSKSDDLTHRENALIYQFKGIQLDRKEMRKIDGKGLEKAFDSLNPKTESKTNPYRAPNIRELKNVIERLTDFPDALASAKAALLKAEKEK